MLHIHFVISVVSRGPFPGILDPDLSSRSRRIGCLSTWLYSQFPNDSLVQSEASEESEHEEHVCFYPVRFDVIFTITNYSRWHLLLHVWLVVHWQRLLEFHCLAESKGVRMNIPPPSPLHSRLCVEIHWLGLKQFHEDFQSLHIAFRTSFGQQTGSHHVLQIWLH